MFVRHIKHERFVRPGLAMTEPQFTNPSLSLEHDHLHDGQIIPEM